LRRGTGWKGISLKGVGGYARNQIRMFPGSYTVVCWFPYGFIQQQTVEIKAAGTAKADFELVKMREEIPHKNKRGKDY
jgi:hypothetical protein